ncbi:MAG: exodeoxyribonuclease VII small subunit [Clostridiales bacterium 43-6]|nr:MAG: exodeoxyribonuclease VII small subunit [Clostridiales bacterium 43-6]
MSDKTFEEAIKRLDEITRLLESGEMPLDSSMKLFEEGTSLADFCNKALSEAEQKIIELTDIKKDETNETQ